jgi:hypothetical protein
MTEEPCSFCHATGFVGTALCQECRGRVWLYLGPAREATPTRIVGTDGSVEVVQESGSLRCARVALALGLVAHQAANSEDDVTEEKAKSITIVGGRAGAGGRGGNTVFDAGSTPYQIDIAFVVEKLNKGLDAIVSTSRLPDGEMIFRVGAREILKIDAEGRFIREGGTVAEDRDVALVLRAWLGYCCAAMGREQDRLIAAENRIAELERLLATGAL